MLFNAQNYDSARLKPTLDCYLTLFYKKIYIYAAFHIDLQTLQIINI